MEKKSIKVIIGSDHRGYGLKRILLSFLKKRNIEYFDAGTNSEDSVDYPDYAKAVAKRILSGEFTRGILICGSGIGMSIAANRFSDIRAALCLNTYMAEMSRKHSDANVLVLSSEQTDKELAQEILEVWFTADFEGGRHKWRLDKIKKIEQG